MPKELNFETFLKEHKINVVDGRVLIDNIDRVRALRDEFDALLAKQKGLLFYLKGREDPILEVLLEVEFTDMERNNQDPTKFNCQLFHPSKNYDDNTWNGTVKGKVKDIWTWAVAESGLHPSEIADNINVALEG